MSKSTSISDGQKVPSARKHAARIDCDALAWLEGGRSADAQDWLRRQSRAIDAYFADSAFQCLNDWLATATARARPFHTQERAGARFMLVDLPGRAHPALMAQRVGAAAKLVFDPADPIEGVGDRLAQDMVEPSPDGDHVAFALTDARGALAQIHAHSLDTGVTEAMPALTIVPRVSWAPSGRGFFYNLNQSGFVSADQRSDRHEGIYWHALGADPGEDSPVFAMREDGAHCAVPSVSSDGRYLFVRLVKLVEDACRVFALPLTDDGAVLEGPPQELTAPYAGACAFIGDGDGRYFFQTNVNAPMGKVVSFSRDGSGALIGRKIIAETDTPLALSPRASRAERACIAGGRLYLTYIAATQHEVRMHALNGDFLGIVDLPQPCAIAGADGERCGRMSPGVGERVLIDLWRYESPPCCLVYDAECKLLSPAAPSSAVELLDKVYAEQWTIPAKDGVNIPVTLLYREAGPLRSARRPCLLYGYGGFGTPILPEFMESAAAFLALGGVYAVAHIRGGGEYGVHWHEAARGRNRQVAFDDFVAAAEALIARGVAEPQRLAAKGLSNGGLLVGAVMTQRPDLFGAIIAEAPLLDPLSIGRDHWSAQLAPEYGDPSSNADDFAAIAAYSPLQHVEPGKAYPPCFVVIGDADADLLVDGAYKFIARLQHETAGGPYLLDRLPGVGHTGWSQTLRCEVAARETAFLIKTLDADFDLRALDGTSR